MPRGAPGEETYTPQVMPEEFPRRINPQMRGPSAGPALEQLGTAIDQKYKTDSATWAGDQLAGFRVKAIQDLESQKQALPAGDPGDFTQKYLAGFDKQATQLADTAGTNPWARQMIDKGVTELRSTLATHTMGWEAEQRVAYRADSVRQNVSSQLPILEAHPELLSQVGSTLMDQINSIPGDPATKVRLGQAMHEQITEAAANGLARQNPRAVLQQLSDPEHANPTLKGLNATQIEAVRAKANNHLADPVFAALSQGDLHTAQGMLNSNADVMDAKTFESVQRGIIAVQEHQLVMGDKEQKRLSDAVSKEGDTLLAQGQLTPKWIQDHRQVLEENEFRYFYKALSGTEEAATDPKTFSDLYLRAANGEDVRDAARSALVDTHTLSRTDFTKIAGIVDTERPGWFKRGAAFISGSLDPGQLNPDPDAHRSRELALQDWQEWAAKHPDATEAQARQMQNDLTDHYRIAPPNTITLAMPAPPHLLGTRTNPVDEQGKPDPMLNATAQRMKGALQRGEISTEEAMREAALIQQYRQIYQRQQAAAKKKAAE